MPSPDPSPDLLVACLCAEWCGTCRDYAATFRALAARFPGARFLWIDVEDEAEWVDPVDVVDFPSALIVRGGKPVFFGPLTPHAETLARLLASSVALQAALPVLPAPEVQALADRILARRSDAHLAVVA